MKCWIILAVAFACLQLAQAAPADKVDCAKLDEALDEFGMQQAMTTLNGKAGLMVKLEDVTKKCQEMNDAIKTLRKYNKECHSALTQQVFSAILRTRSQMIDTYCKPDASEAKSVVEASKCIADNVYDEVNASEKKTILTTQALFEMNIADEKLRVRRACCNVLDSKNHFLAATEPKCTAHKKVYDQYYESYTSEALGLICPDVEKLDCGKLEALKTDGVKMSSKFFLTPTLKLVKTLDH